jgi:hypothetical protein
VPAFSDSAGVIAPALPPGFTAYLQIRSERCRSEGLRYFDSAATH